MLPFLDRLCVEDYPIPGSDVVIKKDTFVYVPMIGLHLDENYFPDPQKFDPERFSEDSNSNQDRPACCYIPFGAGPRLCIGN